MALLRGSLQPGQLTCTRQHPTLACHLQRALGRPALQHRHGMVSLHPAPVSLQLRGPSPLQPLRLTRWGQPHACAGRVSVAGHHNWPWLLKRKSLQERAVANQQVVRPVACTCRQAPTVVRTGRLALLVSASAAAVPPDGEQRSGFVQKLQKSIRDFGFGKRSYVEGGVGIFVFTGIGALSCAEAVGCRSKCVCWQRAQSVTMLDVDTACDKSWCRRGPDASQLGAGRQPLQQGQRLQCEYIHKRFTDASALLPKLMCEFPSLAVYHHCGRSRAVSLERCRSCSAYWSSPQRAASPSARPSGYVPLTSTP